MDAVLSWLTAMSSANRWGGTGDCGAHCLTVCRRHYETAVGGLKEVKTDAKFVLLVSRRLFTCHANGEAPTIAATE